MSQIHTEKKLDRNPKRINKKKGQGKGHHLIMAGQGRRGVESGGAHRADVATLAVPHTACRRGAYVAA